MNSLDEGENPPSQPDATSLPVEAVNRLPLSNEPGEPVWRLCQIGFCGVGGVMASKAVRDLIGMADGDLIDITIARDGVPDDEKIVRLVHKVPKVLVEPLKQSKEPVLFMGPADMELLGIKPGDIAGQCKCGKCPPRENTQVIRARVRVSEDVVECP
jgi:hypothetical protein